jgi:hypothetical protein
VGVADVQAFGERLHVTLTGAATGRADAVAAQLATALREAGVTVESVRVTTPTLEDVFIARIQSTPGETGKEE